MKIFSGIRPTGELHIGNYLGAIKQWIQLQEKNDCIFCIVDLHAITTPYKVEDLQKNILDVATAYLAAGLNPEKCIFFVQSEIKEHLELAWLLGSVTPLGELERMTQFKDKSKSNPEYINAGLLNYPVLMAADILLYKTDAVPVGKDQQQHVELAQTIAGKFNRAFGETFKEPKALISETGAKIMSLKDPSKKMSKSDDSQGCIGLFDEPEEIKIKIAKAVTDAEKEIKYSPVQKPGISNLIVIFSLFSEKSIKEIEKIFENKRNVEFKKSLTELLIEKLEPFRTKKKELKTRELYIKEILKNGARRAQIIADSTIQETKNKMGLA